MNQIIGQTENVKEMGERINNVNQEHSYKKKSAHKKKKGSI